MPLANDLARIGVHDAVRFVNSHRVLVYSLVSFVSVSAVITNALKNQSNFYSVSIYLSKSSRSVLVGISNSYNSTQGSWIPQGFGQLWSALDSVMWPHCSTNLLRCIETQ